MSIDEAVLLLSGQMVRNHHGTFYFDQPGNWIDEGGWPDYNRLHRIDGPALILADGHQEWWANGQLHRENGPAITYVKGKTAYWVSGDFIGLGAPLRVATTQISVDR